MSRNEIADTPDRNSERSKTERVYAELRRRIRELILPPGALLRKEEIALELGVSRAPVSEAIARLADEALVDVYPQHGSFVALIRSRDIRESLFIRTALEVQATGRVAENITPEAIDVLEKNIADQADALDRDDLTTFFELDEEMHAVIFAQLDCPRAAKILDAARAPLDRPRRLALPERDRARQTLREHRRIVDALGSGDPGYASAAMAAHLSRVAEDIDLELVQVDGNAG